MRPSFACARCMLLVSFLSVVSCAEPKIAATGEAAVTLEGDVTLVEASAVEKVLALADSGGVFCTLTSPGFEYELRNLEGHAVRVTGRLLGKTANGPEFLVEDYEMTPVNGRLPVVGVIASASGGLILTETRTGATYRLVGPLAEALRPYCGCKVWVSGSTAPVTEKTGGGGTITIESYGVLMRARFDAGGGR
jgi:hypothetical protein